MAKGEVPEGDLMDSSFRMAPWLLMSTVMVFFNNFLLSYAKFDFPISLAMVQMVFCSVACSALVHLGILKVTPIPAEVYWRFIVPIGALFALSLAFSNAAYLFLSVSFVQMLKTLQPIIFFPMELFFRTEKMSASSLIDLTIIGTGVRVAIQGKFSLSWIGFFFQAVSMVSEGLRLHLIRRMLHKVAKVGSLSILYYIAPWSIVFLLFPFLVFEAETLGRHSSEYITLIPLLLFNSIAAFGLNVSLFLVLKKVSPLSLKIIGCFKDWILLVASISLNLATESYVSLLAYEIALMGVFRWHARTQQHPTPTRCWFLRALRLFDVS